MTSSILSPVLSEHWDEPDAWTLDGYLRHGGYRGLRTALGMDPDAVIALVKEAGLRGRGGAGFPTGAKWSFIPQETVSRTIWWLMPTNPNPAPAKTFR